MSMLNRTAPSSSAGPDRIALTDPTRLLPPAMGTGVLMAAYLLLRPYGDAHTGESIEAARAFASTAWVISHLCGVLAIASFARLMLRVSDQIPGLLPRAGRLTGLAGAVLVLPYYGAETFGLHAVGAAATQAQSTGALSDVTALLALVDPIRNQPAALMSFGLGLLLLAASGILLALTWQRHLRSAAAWPLGVLMALLLPQFYLPPTGRMIYGVLYALAAGLLLTQALRARRAPSRSTRG